MNWSYPLIVAEIVMAVMAITAAVFIGTRRGQNQSLKDTVAAQAETINAFDARLSLLEAEKRALREEVTLLKAENEGRKQGLRDFIEAMTEAEVCLRAPTCDNRVTPGGPWENS